jgi:hypothetical protein
MSELEKVLRRVRPREPSSAYLDQGLARIETFRAPLNLVSRRWQFATVSLALLFAASLGLNILNWIGERQEVASAPRLVFSDLRQEGDLIVRETRYELPGTLEAAHE